LKGENASTAMQDFYLVLRFTRHWIHYGFLTHVVLCTVIAAVEGLLGR
jgi:hypothetical protein